MYLGTYVDVRVVSLSKDVVLHSTARGGRKGVGSGTTDLKSLVAEEAGDEPRGLSRVWECRCLTSLQ